MEILVSKMDQNLVSVSKPAKATELAPRLLDQAGGHPPRSIDNLQGRAAFIPLPMISVLGKREIGHGKDSSGTMGRAKAQGTEAPSVSCPHHGMAFHSRCGS